MRLSEIRLLTDHLAETVQFYTSVLGFKKTYQDDNKVSFAAGSSVLTFIKSGNVHPIYHFAFNIPPLQLQDALGWTKQRVAILPGPDGEEIADFSSWDAKAFYFKDNNGNILEFIARYRLDVDTDQPFGSDSIISISEIGIVTEDVPAARKNILEKYNIPVFSKPPLNDNFTAMGDDEGLFILSKTERMWHPTDIPAQSFYSHTAFISEGVQYDMQTQ